MAFTKLDDISWGNSPTITGAVYYDRQRSGADMQYKVRVVVNSLGGTHYFGYPIYLKIRLNGTTIVTTTMKSASPSQWSSAITYETSGWQTVSNKTSGSVSMSVNLYSGSGSSRDSTYSFSLPVSAAMSTLSAVSGTLGTAQTLTVTRYDSTFKHRISYTCGNASGYIAGSASTYSTALSISWIPPVSLAAQNTTGTRLSVKIKISTYTSGGTLVGSNSYSVSMAIPSSVKPALTLTLSDSLGYASLYGEYVQLRSRLRVVLNKTIAQGSPITSYRIEVGSDVYTSDGVTTPALQASGEINIKATIKDARGRTATKTAIISVIPYHPPKVISMSAERCTSNGTLKVDGDHVKVTFSSSVDPLSNLNSASYSVRYRSPGASTWNSVQMTELNGNYSPSAASTIIPAATDSKCEVTVAAADNFATVPSSIVVVHEGYIAAQYNRAIHSFAFGKEATEEDTFQVADALKARFPADTKIGGQTVAEIAGASESITLTVVPERLTGLSYTAKYYPTPGIVFVRAYGTLSGTFNMGYDYDILNVGSRLPDSQHALSVKSAKMLDAVVKPSGVISVRPHESIDGAWDIFITGFWFA